MTHTAPQPADQPVFKNAAYTQEYIDIAESLDGDIPGRRAARAYMDSSTAIVHHRVVSTSFRAQALRHRIAPGHARGR